MKKIAMVVGEDFWLRIPMNNESAGRHLCMDDVEVIHAWLESGYGGCWTLPLETDGEQLEGVAVKVPGSRLGLGTYAVVMAGKFVNGGHFRTKRQLFIRLVDREEQADAKPTMFNEEKAYWAGPAVLSGMLSRDGLNTYELAVLHGYDGTLEQFLAQAGIELQDFMVTKAKLSREVQTQLDKGSEKAVNPAGDYDAEAEYSVNEMVYDEVTNSSYVSKQSVNVGHAVTDTDWWMKVLDGNYVHTTIQAIMTAAQETLDEAKQDTINATAAALAAKQDTEQATAAANAVVAQKVADAQIGYYVCETAAGTATKATTTDTIGQSKFAVPVKGCIVKVKMTNANTATGTVYLQFGSDVNTKKELKYNGLAVDDSNSWEDGEVISVYYDGTYYQASNAQGGSKKIAETVDKMIEWRDVPSSYLGSYGFPSVDEGYINVTGTNKTKYTHTFFKIPEGSTLLKITGNATNGSLFFFADSYTLPTTNGQSIPACDSFPSRVYVRAGKSKIFDVPEDCAYLIFGVLGNDVDYFPSKISFGYTDDSINKAKPAHIEYDTPFFVGDSNDTRYLCFKNQNGILLGNAFLVDSTNRIFKIIERDKDAVSIKVTSRENNPSTIAFLKSYTQPAVRGEKADLCDECASSCITPGGTTMEYLIPDDCNYILFNHFNGTSSVFPASLSFGFDNSTTYQEALWQDKTHDSWKDKSLCVIGDSVSTYTGYTWQVGRDSSGSSPYDGTTLGVTSVSDTWWMRFFNVAGFARLQNLSGGGYAVMPRDNWGASLYQRACVVDNDCSLIIVALGANDSGQQFTIGEADYDIPTESLTEDTFYNALIKGVRKLMEDHPNIPIVLFCTAPSSSDYTAAEEAVAEHYGLMFLKMADLYTWNNSLYVSPDVHPRLEDMARIFNGLLEYLKTKEFALLPKNEVHGMKELTWTVVQGSIDVGTGAYVSTEDSYRKSTSKIDVGNATKIIKERGHLNGDYRPCCYDYEQNYIGVAQTGTNSNEYNLLQGTRYIAVSLTTSSQNVSAPNCYKIYAVCGEEENYAAEGFEVFLSDFMNSEQTDQQNIEDCMAFASAFDKKTIHFDVPYLEVSGAILIPGNTTILLENCVIKQADGTFDNVFRSANLNPNGNGGQDMPSDIPIIENIKIIGIGKANIIGPDVNATSGGSELVGDAYGFRTWQICFVRTHGVEISNVSFTKTRCWCITFELCENVSVHDIAIRSNVKNGDGVDFRVGCKHCEVYNMFASTTDDAVACTALGNLAEATGDYCGEPTWRLWQSLLADNSSALDIEDVSVRNIRFSQTVNSSLNGGHGMICLSAYGSKVHNVSVDSFTELTFGDNNNDGLIKIYHGYGSGYTAGDLNTIRLNDIVCTHFPYTLQVTGGIVEDVRANKLVNNASGGSTVSVSSGNVIGENVIVTNS